MLPWYVNTLVYFNITVLFIQSFIKILGGVCLILMKTISHTKYGFLTFKKKKKKKVNKFLFKQK